jgi:hypothetical protein
MTQSLIGQATHVWIVEHNGTRCILKDAWIEKSCPISEAKHLENTRGMEGIPELVCAEDITIDGVALSMGSVHHGLNGNKNRVQIRHQIVTSSCGSHIAEFHSKCELISALRDIVVSVSCFYYLIP